ncbi:hypothetical protein TH53_24645 [Pedobacter lusitanus]|uniref:Uncharacterized protein n=1 Tax=Pedobacter lusitanus TaxID=1503925 RepID=A0A0D0FQM3_9SPHI|nr:hypothetical protein [Pedobacter lusitanus]KIO74754.1 hypothetical protein TH53_24645 [Pedobacter lusitanus]
MKKFKFSMLLFVAAFLSLPAFSQVSMKISKPLSERDKQELQQALKSFDANSYMVDVKTEKGVLKSGNARGLASVKQGTTVRPDLAGKAASTNTNINIFKNAAASTNTNINIFKSSAASTNTNINIFKNGKFTDAQLTQLDKVHQILSKYE